jgi:hypothetical protein
MSRTRLLLFALAVLASSRLAFAGPAVVIDGQLQDMIDRAGSIDPAAGCGLVETDLAKDILLFDPDVVPCVPVIDNYYPNAYDQILDVLLYDRSAQTLYLGLRVSGAIGDLDGNGNPNSGCAEATLQEELGIGVNDRYRWTLNLDCAGDAEVEIELSNNTVTVTGAPYSSATYAYLGSDVEIAITGLVLPAGFDARVFSGNQFDGMGEDFHPLSCAGPAGCFTLEPGCPPATACGGSTVTLAGDVRNCSQAPEVIVVTLGAEVRVLGPIPPGSSFSYSFDVVMPSCDSGASATFVVRAGPGACADGETVEATCVVACETCEPVRCRLSGGACVNVLDQGSARSRHTFGGDLGPCPAGPGDPGVAPWTHEVRNGREIAFAFRADEACLSACDEIPDAACDRASGDVRVEFGGSGWYRTGVESSERACSFTASVVDRSRGACGGSGRDEYGIRVVDRATQQVVFELEPRPIECGNLHVREPRALAGSATGLDPEAGDVEGVSPLGRPYPNPFAASMSFGYEVSSGEGQGVEIGIYDVAGRLITRLASGFRTPGRYTVTWDGRDASGLPMAPGVYFLRSRVGPSETVRRLLRVAP